MRTTTPTLLKNKHRGGRSIFHFLQMIPNYMNNDICRLLQYLEEWRRKNNIQKELCKTHNGRYRKFHEYSFLQSLCLYIMYAGVSSSFICTGQSDLFNPQARRGENRTGSGKKEHILWFIFILISHDTIMEEIGKETENNGLVVLANEDISFKSYNTMIPQLRRIEKTNL